MMYPWLDYKGLAYYSKKLRDKLKTAFNDVYEKITGMSDSIEKIDTTLGDADISEIDGGTLTGAVSEFNSALATTPHYVGELSTSTDLNELFITGIYEGSNGNVPQNAPDEAVTTSSIIVTVYHENSLGNNFTIQEYTQVVSGELQKYMRRYSGSAWNDWDSYAKNSALDTTNQNVTQNASDISKLNSALTNGSVTKVGTSSVGSGTHPIYLSSGTPTESSSTVGSSYRPVYMNAGTLTQCASALFYTAGDTFNIMYYGAGYVTSSGSTVHFTIAVAREFSGVSSLSVTSKGSATIRQNNSYCYGSSADGGVTPSSITVNSYGSGTGLLHMTMTFSNTTNITNNSAVGIALSSTTISCS